VRILRVGGRVLICDTAAGYDPPEDICHLWTFEFADPRFEWLGARECDGPPYLVQDVAFTMAAPSTKGVPPC
jgi:ubiquinone/menaquinone biosynthesis C-methylase UbiE